MKSFYYIGIVLILISGLIAGCNKGSEQVKENPNKEKAPASETNKGEQKEKSNEPNAQKGTPEWDLQQIEKAVNDNNQELFMSYQNKENPTFYKEQKRWIEEADFKKKQGYQLSVDLSNFYQENDTKGTVDFKVMMSHPKLKATSNSVTYQMIKVNHKWILNDMPFEQLSSEAGNVTVYFNKGQEEAAQKTLKDASDIVNYYSKTFNWKPGPLSIKVYPDNPTVSATVPWIMLAGWNEVGESIKITTSLTSEIFRFLAHELTHKMLGDLTNDNATIYIQEGFATYLEVSIHRDEHGNVTFDPQQATARTSKAIELSKSVKTIEELGKIDYTDPEGSMYRDGFLLSNYLIQTKGLNKFLDMLHYLAKFEYIDKRNEHKMNTCQVRTVEAIEKVYGPVDKVSSDCKNYYIK